MQPHIITGMATRIRKGSRTHLYIKEWMDHKGLSDADLANRMGTSRTTVWRWHKEQWRLRPEKIAHLAHAIGIKAEKFYEPPREEKRESIDALLKDATDNDFETALELAKRLARRAS